MDQEKNKSQDKELVAIKKVLQAIDELDPSHASRVLEYAFNRVKEKMDKKFGWASANFGAREVPWQEQAKELLEDLSKEKRRICEKYSERDVLNDGRLVGITDNPQTKWANEKI